MIIITEPNQNVGLVLVEILRSMSWSNVFVTPEPGEAFERIRHGKAKYLIIDDNNEHPAALVLRHQLTEPVAAITPTLALIQRNSTLTTGVLATMGRPMVIEKPVSPGRFAPAFNTLVKVWSNGFFKDISQAAHKLARQEVDVGIQILTKLTRNPKAQALIAPTVSSFLRQNGDLQVAEKILLNALKSTPKSLGLSLALSDLYLHTAMPQTAMRVIQNIELSFGKNPATLLDKLQAALMLLDLNTAIEVLNEMKTRHFHSNLLDEYLARIYFTQGLINEFKRTIDSDNKLKKFQTCWSGETKRNAA